MSGPFDCLPAAVAQDKAVGQAPLGGALILIRLCKLQNGSATGIGVCRPVLLFIAAMPPLSG